MPGRRERARRPSRLRLSVRVHSRCGKARKQRQASTAAPATDLLITSAPRARRLAPGRTLLSSPVPSCGSSRSAKEPHIAGSGEDKRAATLQTTDTRTTTYALLVIFTVHPNSERNLHDQQASATGRKAGSRARTARPTPLAPAAARMTVAADRPPDTSIHAVENPLPNRPS